METVKRAAATQSLAKEDSLKSNECTGGLNEWVGGAAGGTMQLCPARVWSCSPRSGSQYQKLEVCLNMRRKI